MTVNPFTSKTVIGAITAAIGYLTGVPELAGYSEFLNALSAIITAIGGILFAVGVRDAIGKAAVGKVQMHPLALVGAVIVSLLMWAVILRAAEPQFAAYTTDDEYHPWGSERAQFAGDSVKVVLLWTQPPDTVAKGKVDSTVYVLRSSKPGLWYTGTAITANVNVRRVKTTLADSLRIRKPLLGDSAIFQVSGFIQCRRGDCSPPGSAAFSYRHTYAPPSTVPKLRIETF